MPTYNHTREDSPRYPCPECVLALRIEAALARMGVEAAARFDDKLRWSRSDLATDLAAHLSLNQDGSLTM